MLKSLSANFNLSVGLLLWFMSILDYGSEFFTFSNFHKLFIVFWILYMKELQKLQNMSSQ